MSHKERPAPGKLSAKVLSSSVWTAGGSIFSLLLATASTIIVARYLGPRGFGQYAVYSLILSLVPSLTDLGVSQVLSRRTSVATGSSDRKGVTQALQMSLGWSLLRLPLVITAAFLLLPFGAAAAVGVSQAIGLLGSTTSLLLGARAHARPLVLASLVSSTVSAIASSGLAIAGHNPAVVYAFPTAFAALPSAALLFLRQEDIGIAERLRPRRLRLSRAEWLFSAGTWFNGQLVSFVATRTEILFFKASQVVPRGEFTAGLSVAARSTTALDALFGPLSAAMAVKAGQSPAGLQAAAEKSLRLTGFLCMLVTAPLTAASVFLAYPLFGTAFRDIGLVAVLPLTLASVFGTALHPVYSYYFARRLVWPGTVAAISGVGVDIILASILIPRIGLQGAVIASVGSDVGLLGALLLYLLLADDLRAAILRHIAVLSLTLMGTSVVVSLTSVTTQHESLLVRGVMGIVASLVFSVLLIRWLVVVTDDDIAYLVELFRYSPWRALATPLQYIPRRPGARSSLAAIPGIK